MESKPTIHTTSPQKKASDIFLIIGDFNVCTIRNIHANTTAWIYFSKTEGISIGSSLLSLDFSIGILKV
jgi:hypothetical protein